ncbi:SAM-dependent methyltransferase [Agromyces sp. Marseille-P2726]|uniref:SAM-dependent methyltransferase n=1 Tax=Agromyces sp. Marseille-P2726 TaxID=2709132 RepID=UPI00156FF02E|nr:SAM-dependent methyltransferase [Agromyces sp. Marseille-P2726]
MSEIIEVSSDWLALREAEDARARSRELARAAARRLRSGPIVIHDLGSGTGSMMRWLAPLLPGPQTWVLHDWNPSLVDCAANGAVPVDRRGRPVSVHTRSGELAQLDPDDLEGASLVTASAVLDVLTSDELGTVARACVTVGSPVLLTLSVTGKVRLDPPDPRDDAFAAAFNAHQERLVGGRRLMGPAGAALAQRLFLEAGWHVRAVTTLWRLGGHDPLLVEQWFDGWWDAALEERPDLEVEGAQYRATRSTQMRRSALAVTVAHTDLLAWP